MTIRVAPVRFLFVKRKPMRKYLLLVTIIVFVAAFVSPVEACETTEMTFVGILDSSSSITIPPNNPSSFAELDASASYHTSEELIDGLGQSHSIFLYFFRVAPLGWEIFAYFDGADITSGTQDVPSPAGSSNLEFDSSGNLLPLPYLLQSNPSWSNGAPSGQIVTHFIGFSQIFASSRITYATHDGSAGGCSARSATVDFDRDGKNDYSVFRPEFGMWYIIKSSSLTRETIIKQWGLPGDYPFAGDYTGDGKADLVVWRPLNGNWYICRSETDFDCSEGVVQQWGLSGDRPVKGDFDGDGILDFAIWRTEFGVFIYRRSETGEAVMQQWGLPPDIPLSAGTDR